jgi:hypothetical protein
MLLLMIVFLRHMGLQGLALSRLCYGSVALLVYLPLLGKLTAENRSRTCISPASLAYEAHEEARP